MHITSEKLDCCVVTLFVHNVCNFNCSYCSDYHRDGTSRWPKNWAPYLQLIEELKQRNENLYIEVSEKYESFFLKTAEERYLDLLISEPKVIEKIPQFMIASYLGVSPEGLSRIKNRIAKK